MTVISSGLALSERARLIDDERVHLSERLDRRGIPEEDTFRGPSACGHHDRNWGCQAQRARAGNDEYRDRIHDRVRHPRLGSDKGPDGKRRDGDQQDRRNEVRGNYVSQPLNRGSSALGVRNHLYDLTKQGVLSHAIGANDKRTGPVDGAADDMVVRTLLDRDRLSRHHRLVHRRSSFENDAVHRHLFPGPDAKSIADLNLGQEHILIFPVSGDASRRLGCQSEERLDGRACSAASTKLQDLAEEHQRSDDGGSLVIDPDLPRRSAQPDGKETGGDGRYHAVAIRDRDAESDQGEHIERAVHDRQPRPHEERPAAPENDGRRQSELDPDAHPVRDDPFGGISWYEVRHRDQHEGNRESDPDPEATSHLLELRVLLLVE